MSGTILTRYSERDKKRSVDQRCHCLAMIDLEPLYPDRRILAEKPIDYAGIVATISQSELDFSDGGRVGRIGRVRLGWQDRFLRARAQRKNHSDQKHESPYFCHLSFFHSSLIRSYFVQLRPTVVHYHSTNRRDSASLTLVQADGQIQ
jgi:hypothetical protein